MIHDGSVAKSHGTASLVERMSYLANKATQYRNVLSGLRFTLHEIRVTKNKAADRRVQQNCW
jgi:hypothetical protein